MNFKSLLLAVLAISISYVSKANNGDPNKDSATLIIYRDYNLYGSWANYPVMIDGKKMDMLDNKDSYTMKVVPGEHTIAPKNDKKTITVNFEAGKTYVVKYKTQFGLLGANGKPVQMTEMAAEKDSKYYKEVAMMKK